MAIPGGNPPAARKRKPPPPRQVQLAETQAKTYASQGQAVDSAAHQQRAVARARRTAVNAGRAQAVRITRAGVTPPVVKPEGGTALSAPSTKAPAQRPLSMVDVLDPKTGRFKPNDQVVRRQQQHAIDAGVAHLMTTGRSLHKQEGTIERLRQLGVVPGTSEFQHAVDRFNVRQSQLRQATHKQTADDLLLTDPQSLKEAGFHKAGALDKLAQLPARVLPTLAVGGYQTARATVEDPLHVIPKTAAGIARATVGIPAGLVESTIHPVEAAKALIANYEHRYGSVLKDPAAFRARIKKEGATGELFDIATVLSAGGASAGRAAQGLAEAGRLGKTAERVATRRPDLRVSGNVVRQQPVSENFGRNVARAVTDRRRATVQVRRAGREDAPLEVRQAEAEGQVTYTSRRKQARQQRVAIAREKSASIQRLKAQQQQELRQGRRDVASLSKDERRGLKHAVQTGAMTPEAARATIAKRIGIIEAERAERSAARPGYQVSKRRDELPELKWLHDHADEVFTPKLREVAQRAQAAERRQIHVGDPGVDPVQAQLRRYAQQAPLVGVTRTEGETNAHYLRRVTRARREAGLERPGYFPSEERPRGVFSAMALGGAKATEIPKAYSGSLFRQGVESSDPEVLLRGRSRTIKRREQWNVVGRNFEKHTVPTLAGRPMRNQSILELTRSLENAGVDPNTVGFWNPRRFYEASKRAQAQAESVPGGDLHGLDVGHGATDVHAALRDATATPHDLMTKPEDFAKSSGWSVVPKEILNELESQTRSTGVGGRVVDITRGKVSRVLLGNPAWLSIQVGSNVLMTGLAGVGPVTALKAQAWWRGLSHEERMAVAPELGIHGWIDEQTHLGAATNNRFVNAYRAFKTTGMYQKAHAANPLDAIFRADNAQNNFFRKAVAYNEAKREAYKRMGESTKGIMRAQVEVQRLLGRAPADRILEALRDPAVFERHAEKVRDFLGDYTTYTAKERRTLGRYAMFYGFLRNSLRMAFYTLPVKHPVMSAIGLELGKLHDDELKRLFGTDVPVWEQGNAFIGGKKFPLARLNPFFNAIQYDGPGSLMQIGSPFLSIAADQIAGKNITFDRLWKTHGSTQYVISGKDASIADRARIALAAVLHLSPYLRLAEKTGIPGVAKPLVGSQSDTSSLIFPEPTRYKQGPAVARNAKRIQQEQGKSIGQTLQEQLFPLAGQPSAPTIQSAQDYARSQGQVVGGVSSPLSPQQQRALERGRRATPAQGGAALQRALARARRAAGG